MFAFGEGMDPKSCWVTNGELYVSQTPTGAANERDVAAFWREWFTWAFAVYCALCVLPIAAGTFVCIGDAVAVVGQLFGGCTSIAMCVKCGLWIWALFWIRFTTEGSVTAGKMIRECMMANPNLNPAVNTSDAVADPAVDTAESEVIGITGFSCDDPNAFQTKGGKLIFAWLIISCICFK